MTLDYQKVSEQVQLLGAEAPARLLRLKELRQQARDLLMAHAGEAERLNRKIDTIVRLHDPNLRCARPAAGPQGTYESLNSTHALPPVPRQGTILAADGSQINPDRHAAVNFGLINIGSIQMSIGSTDAPRVSLQSELIFGDRLYSTEGTIGEAQLALMRDLRERKQLAELSDIASPPVFTFTDGPMELWGGRDAETSREFQKSMEEYREVLNRLEGLSVATAGYVDKPASNLVVRLLEVASLPEDQLPKTRATSPLRGVLDRGLLWDLLSPGERSSIFAIQSNSAKNYPGPLELHFFYLNVGRSGHPWLARVEVPSWVVSSPGMLDDLHSILLQQCRVLGNRPYPYLLHRAHEAALVTWQDRQQVAAMIEMELRSRGVDVGEASQKQALKDLER